MAKSTALRGQVEEIDHRISTAKGRCQFSGNILFVHLDEGIQRGKNTLHIHKVDLGLDAVAPMVFAKILPKELIDMAG